MAVVIVVTLSTSLNWLVYNKVLIVAGNYLSSISPVPIRLEKIFYLTVFIVTIATFVQILGVLPQTFRNGHISTNGTISGVDYRQLHSSRQFHVYHTFRFVFYGYNRNSIRVWTSLVDGMRMAFPIEAPQAICAF